MAGSSEEGVERGARFVKGPGTWERGKEPEGLQETGVRSWEGSLQGSGSREAGDGSEKAEDNFVRIDPLGLGLEGGHDSVAQHG
jgi:hypothetical protein